MIEESAGYSEAERERFPSGELVEIWARIYPQLFDPEDLRIALGQPDYHFFEWLAAIHYYRKLGYLSLVEKHFSPKHERKKAVLEALLSHGSYVASILILAGVGFNPPICWCTPPTTPTGSSAR